MPQNRNRYKLLIPKRLRDVLRVDGDGGRSVFGNLRSRFRDN